MLRVALAVLVLGLMAIDRVYHIGPRDLDLAPADFAQLLADRERMTDAGSYGGARQV
jgi:hypothetical protein